MKKAFTEFDRERAEMYRRHNRTRMPGEPSSFDILYEIIKAGDPELKGSEEVRQTYSKPR
jgi:hypothetical protein